MIFSNVSQAGSITTESCSCTPTTSSVFLNCTAALAVHRAGAGRDCRGDLGPPRRLAQGAALIWGSLLARILARPGARRAAAIALVALTIALLILNLCRTAERASRLVERLETTEKANDVQRQMLDAAARRPRDRNDLADRLRNGRF